MLHSSKAIRTIAKSGRKQRAEREHNRHRSQKEQVDARVRDYEQTSEAEASWVEA